MSFPNRLKIGPKISIGFGVILVFMSIVSMLVYFSISSIAEASSLIERGGALMSDRPKQMARWEEVGALQTKWLTEGAEGEMQARRQVALGAEAAERFTEVPSRTPEQEIFGSIRDKLDSLYLKFKNENNVRGLQLVNQLTVDLLNTETSQRGFLLDGVESAVKPFLLRKQVEQHVADLIEVTETSIVAEGEVKAFKAKVDEWIREIAQPEIKARREVNLYPANMGTITRMVGERWGRSAWI